MLHGGGWRQRKTEENRDCQSRDAPPADVSLTYNSRRQARVGDSEAGQASCGPGVLIQEGAVSGELGRARGGTAGLEQSCSRCEDPRARGIATGNQGNSTQDAGIR